MNKMSKNMKKPIILQQTWLLIFTVSASYIMFLLRYNLSVAIVAITDEKLNDTLIDEFINRTEDVSRLPDPSFNRKYPFDEMLVGQILASYFYGYTVFQLPAGRMSELFGGKWLLGLGTLGSGILSFLSPTILDISPYALIGCRIAIGTLQCAILTCSYTLFAEWLPNSKKSNTITLINVGFELGGVSSFFFTGFISTYLGCRYSFYLFSFLAFAWFVPFCFIISSRPETDPRISEYELELIKEQRKNENAIADSNNTSKLIKIPPKLSWRIILTSGPVWASSIAKSALGLSYYMITTRLPVYLRDLFHLPLEDNGLLVAVACSGILSSKILCFYVSDFLMKKMNMSRTNFRKTFQAVAMLTPALCLFIITLKSDSKTLDIVLIFFAMFGTGFVCLGDTPITAEFSRDLSGSIFGFTNTFACFCGVVAPVMSSIFLKHFEDDKVFAWNLTFYVTIVALVAALTVFLVFASAESQKWAECEYRFEDEEDEKEIEFSCSVVQSSK